MTHDTPIDDLFTMAPWQHQRRSVHSAIDAIKTGTHTCITSPTGSGKTITQAAIIRWCRDNDKKVILYTNRIMLTEQTMRVLNEGEIYHGVIAASQREARAKLADVQIASVQTVYSRSLRTNKEDLFDADLVLVDEAHVIKTGSHLEVLEAHKERGATLVGFTATPLGVNHIYGKLYVAANNANCRECGALVPAKFKVPSELDCSKLKMQSNGEFSLAEIREKVWTTEIIGHVFDAWKKHNPDARPTLGFAPGVKESQWFVDRFTDRGVRTAHIDGEDIYVDGEYYKSDHAARQQVVEEWKAGYIKVIWNRFVLREGIDFPWMYHLIIACPIGSLISYIQCAGRVLRKSPETPDNVLISDHGGNYWRHMYSPNDNINWQYYYDLDPSVPTRHQRKKLAEDPEREPLRCPKCETIIRYGRDCPPPPFGCGHRVGKRKRMVLQHNGVLKEVTKPAVWNPPVRVRKNTWQLWEAMYHRMKRAGKTFAQARGFFLHKNFYYPPVDMPLMPHDELDWFRRIDKVSQSDLITVQDHRFICESEGKEPVV